MNTFEKGMTRLLVAQLAELYHCEKELMHAMENMAKAARSEELKYCFRDHRRETEEHLLRLESMFSSLGMVPAAFPCRAVEGLLEDVQGIMRNLKSDPMLDTALIAAAQKVEMIETASYRSAIGLARQLGHDHIAQLCEMTLKEEFDADRKLAEVAMAMEGSLKD